MPKKRYFLPFELDAFANCGLIGNACGLRVEQVSHGMLTMWQWVWRTRNPVVTAGQLVGFFFGANPAPALVDFGHLEPTEVGWRVKGAAEWLRVQTAQSEAGKAKAGNLIPGGPKASATPSASVPKRAEAETKPIGSPSALPATSDQPPAKDSSPVKPAPVEKPRKLSDQQAWAVTAQARRLAMRPGLIAETLDPAQLNANLKPFMTSIGTVGLDLAYGAFLTDEWAVRAGWPWPAFVAGIPKYHASALSAGPPRPPAKKHGPPAPLPPEWQ